MKRRVFFVVIFLVFCNCTYAQFWKRLGGAIIGGAADKINRYIGFTPEESRDIINTVTTIAGGNPQNVTSGIDFINADKNTQIHTVVNEAVGAAGELTGRTDVTEVIQTGVNEGFNVSNADNKEPAINEAVYNMGMALYDYREKQKNRPKGKPDIGPDSYPYEPNGGEIPITPYENHHELSQTEKGKEEEIVSNFVPFEEQEASESSEYIETVEAFNADQKESETTVGKEEKDVVLSDIPQESKPVIEVSEPSVSITQPVALPMTSQESITVEESKQDTEEFPVNNSIVKDSQKITGTYKPKKQKAEYLYDITNESPRFEDSKPAEKNITDALLVPIVKECGVGEYPFNSVELSEDSKRELDKLYDILTKNVDLHIKITGHTCNVGSEAANFRVGWERAKKWKDYLVEKGIDTERILLDSKGEKQPIVSNITSANRERNRRVEIDVLMNPEEEEVIRMQVNRQVQLYAPRTFRVQIMATPKPIENYDSVFIMGYDIYDPMEEEVGYVKGKTVYRYVSEEMHSREDAKALRDYFVKRGFKDAWIVEYKGGERIPF